jgi:protein involved in polysaccharide export with SLBB domain
MKSIRHTAVLCAALLLCAVAKGQLPYIPPLAAGNQTETNGKTSSRSDTGLGTDLGSSRAQLDTQVAMPPGGTLQLGLAAAPGTSTRNESNSALRRQDWNNGSRPLPNPPLSTEFSRYASNLVGQTLPVFGADFFSRLTSDTTLASPTVPADYLINVGDEVLIQITGPMEAELRQQVRRGGDITLPKVGAVRVAGTPASDLPSLLQNRLASQFRSIQVSTSLVSLRGMRVYVTGFVTNPGPVVVDGLSTIASAIGAAGGPAPGGSTRIAELWRKGRKLATFDMYRFLISGDASDDRSLTADDVIRVLPVSPFQVAITGSINRPAVYELLEGESLKDLFEFAGGLTPVADQRRLGIVQIGDGGARVLKELSLDGRNSHELTPGAVMQVFALASLSQPVKSSSKIIHVEGEVNNPGSYVLPADATLDDALKAAAGLTADAHTSSITLLRPELAKQQQQQFDRSLDELEKSVFEALNTSTNSGGSQAESAAAIAANTRNYIERLRQVKPAGRLILARKGTTGYGAPLLINGDRIVVPHKPQAVSVFGAAYGEGSYQTTAPITLTEVLDKAGGLRPGADKDSIVILRHDGSFSTTHKRWFDLTRQSMVEPGDTVFVPTDAQRGRFWSVMRDIGTMLSQFGLGAAALKALN